MKEINNYIAESRQKSKAINFKYTDEVNSDVMPGVLVKYDKPGTIVGGKFTASDKNAIKNADSLTKKLGIDIANKSDLKGDGYFCYFVLGENPKSGAVYSVSLDGVMAIE